MKKNLQNSDIIEFSTLETKCVYLPFEKMKMEYKYIRDCNYEFNSELVKRGWRRFGSYYSRPKCKSCSKCQSLRIDVDNFSFSRSVKRVIKKNSKTKIVIRKPSVSIEHLKLYDKYHKHMQLKKGWDYFSVNADSYYDLYVKGSSSYGKEVLYIKDDRLVGVDLIDFLSDGISAIYFYYDPDYSHLSLGNYSIYKQIKIAKEKNLKWIYLGYYVEDCNSLNYKIRYQPYQILKNNPNLEQSPIWI